MPLNSLIPLQVQGPDFSQAAKTLGEGDARRRDEKLAGIATQTEQSGAPTAEAEDALARLAVSNPLAARMTQSIMASKQAGIQAAYRGQLEAGAKDAIRLSRMEPQQLQQELSRRLSATTPGTPDYQELSDLLNKPYSVQQVELTQDVDDFKLALTAGADLFKEEKGTVLAKDAALVKDGKIVVRNDDPNASAEADRKDREIAVKEGGLAVQQENAALAREKFDAEQAKVGGPNDPKAFEKSKALTTAFEKQSGDFIKLNAAIGKIRTAPDTGQGDIALIFSYAKILDPVSTVREGEFDTLQSAAGVSERVKQLGQQVADGRRLTGPQRTELMGAAEALFASEEQQHVKREANFRKRAMTAGINPDLVVYDVRTAGDAPSATNIDALVNKYAQ